MDCYNLLKLSFSSSSSSSPSPHWPTEATTMIKVKPTRNNGIRSLHTKPLILVKISCTVFFMGTFSAGMSSYFFKWNEGFLILGTQFAGGIFLGTALMHFQSDSNKTFCGFSDWHRSWAQLKIEGGMDLRHFDRSGMRVTQLTRQSLLTHPITSFWLCCLELDQTAYFKN
ncbi:unnamed protein product [Malus baccata var. baccata]